MRVWKNYIFWINNNPPSSPLNIRGDKKGAIPPLKIKGRTGGVKGRWGEITKNTSFPGLTRESRFLSRRLPKQFEIGESRGFRIQQEYSVLSLTVLYIFFFRHSRANGNPVAMVLDSCLRRNDSLSKVIYKTAHYLISKEVRACWLVVSSWTCFGISTCPDFLTFNWWNRDPETSSGWQLY